MGFIYETDSAYNSKDIKLGKSCPTVKGIPKILFHMVELRALLVYAKFNEDIYV